MEQKNEVEREREREMGQNTEKDLCGYRDNRERERGTVRDEVERVERNEYRGIERN